MFGMRNCLKQSFGSQRFRWTVRLDGRETVSLPIIHHRSCSGLGCIDISGYSDPILLTHLLITTDPFLPFADRGDEVRETACILFLSKIDVVKLNQH